MVNLEDQGVENTERNAVVQALRVKPVDTAVDALAAAPAVAHVQPALVTRAQNTAALNDATVVDAVVNSICLQYYYIMHFIITIRFGYYKKLINIINTK